MDHGFPGDSSAVRPGSGIAIPLNVGNSRISESHRPPMETEIKAALTALLQAIKASDGQAIVEEMTKLDDFLDRGRAGLHPQLVHYLGNRSYAKALQFLGGEVDIPAGPCGGRRAAS